ncbi:TPA: hypothetical protein NJ322_005023 [Vibrio parahaemolyticus]|nr:hypothetical protein [Vibrio parahaemolyticus]HCG7105667.1 hypothetical protein [Vibrio parahaemolyticus]
MNKPAVTQILDLIHDRIINITKKNGYGFDLLVLKRSHLTPFKAGDLPAVNYWPGTDTYVTQASSTEVREVPIVIEAYDRHGDMSLADKAALLERDIHTALWRSPDAPRVIDRPSPRLGGLVESFSIISSQPAIGEGQTPYCGAVIEIIVRYRVDEADRTKLIS